jgi:hypothetical protein
VQFAFIGRKFRNFRYVVVSFQIHVQYPHVLLICHKTLNAKWAAADLYAGIRWGYKNLMYCLLLILRCGYERSLLAVFQVTACDV